MLWLTGQLETMPTIVQILDAGNNEKYLWNPIMVMVTLKPQWFGNDQI